MPKTPLRRRTDPPQAGEPDLLRALVVDDHEPYLQYIAELVSRFGFQVTAAADGTRALAALREHAPFHLLIIDFEMPRMSGLALIAAVRAQEQFSDVYAVMLTAREDVGTKISALRLGFDDYMIKSASEVELIAKLSAARRLVWRQHRLNETVRELYGLATRDELTGVFNRRLFFAEGERLLAEGAPVGVVFFDLDDFKRVNDTFGHLAGDRLLRDIGSLFLIRTRQEDLIARYGGDEFVMLVLSLAPAEVEVLARRMVEQIASQQWTFGAETFSLGVTTGVACSSQLQQPTLPQLLSLGDRDLYRNKWLRKNPGVDPALYTYDAAREERMSGE